MGKTHSWQYYAWSTAIAGAVVIICCNNLQYLFGTFMTPIMERFEVTRTVASGVMSIRGLTMAISAFISGVLLDRIGLRRVVVIGIILCGLGYLLTAFATEVWQLYVLFGLLMGIGGGFTFSPLVAATTKWFGGKSALANGVVLSGFGFAQILLPPLLTSLFISYGWQVCLLTLAGLSWIGGLLAWNRLHDPPSSHVQEIVAASAGSDASAVPSEPVGLSLRQAMTRRGYWIFLLIYFANALSFSTVITHIVVRATDLGIAATAAAVILTVIGVPNTVGRILVGLVANRINQRLIVSLAFLLQAPIVFTLGWITELWVFYVVGAVYGLIYGTVQPLVPTLAVGHFGGRSLGSILGTINFAYVFGAMLGPIFAGVMFDVSGSYMVAFMVNGSILLLVFLLSLALKPPRFA
jgi:MFS family permease